jgi:hypothetical protein
MQSRVRTHPGRHNSIRRDASIARTRTATRVTAMGDLPLGEESVVYMDVYDPYWSARANLYGDTCSGTGDTREEALEAARRRCEEFKVWKEREGL